MMAFPRRLYLLVFFAAFALLSTFLVLGRGGYGTSGITSGISSGVGDGWSGRFGGGKSFGSTGGVEGDIGGGDVVVVTVGEEEEKEEESAAKMIAGNMIAALAGSSNGNGVPISLLHPSPRKELRVAVVESGGENEEVTAALVYAFGQQPLSPISLYTLEQRFQMGEIIREFNLSAPLAANKSSLDFADAVDGPGFPQLLISASCELDLIRLHDPFEALRKAGKTYLYCVVNDADAWKEGELVEKIRPWVHQQMIDFVTLSSHTAHHLRTSAIANWAFNATVTVQWLPPVFPVNIPDQPEEKTIQTSNNFPFALYTDADPVQNNYTDIFSSLVPVLEQASNVTNDVDTQHARNVQLYLLGRHTAPKIPSRLKRNTIYNPTQSYKEYYTLLSQTFALVPYLPLPTHLTTRASPAIPAALIAGAPLIGNVELLDAYSYVPRDAVWFSLFGEGEMDTVGRVVQWSAPEHWRKRRVVKGAFEGVLRRNEGVVGEWVGLAQRRIERAGWRMEVEGAAAVVAAAGDL